MKWGTGVWRLQKDMEKSLVYQRMVDFRAALLSVNAWDMHRIQSPPGLLGAHKDLQFTTLDLLQWGVWCQFLGEGPKVFLLDVKADGDRACLSFAYQTWQKKSALESEEWIES